MTIEATIDTILRGYLKLQLEEAGAAKAKRIRIVERRLRDFLETHAEQTLCSCNTTILQAERQFDPSGAFARTMNADHLIVALELFLRGPVERDDHLLLETYLDFIEGLAFGLVRGGVVDLDELHEVVDDLADLLAWWTSRAAKMKREKRMRRVR